MSDNIKESFEAWKVKNTECFRAETITDPKYLENRLWHAYHSGLNERGAEVEVLTKERDQLREENQRTHKILNTPEIEDFLKGVQFEQAHQIEKWGPQEDRAPEHFILVANKLLGKLAVAIFDNDLEKFKHHSITLAAVMSQMHRLLKIDWYVAVFFPQDEPLSSTSETDKQ